MGRRIGGLANKLTTDEFADALYVYIASPMARPLKISIRCAIARAQVSAFTGRYSWRPLFPSDHGASHFDFDNAWTISLGVIWPHTIGYNWFENWRGGPKPISASLFQAESLP